MPDGHPAPGTPPRLRPGGPDVHGDGYGYAQHLGAGTGQGPGGHGP
ncbi:hypothetical protein [Streptomyces sp. NPDC007369]